MLHQCIPQTRETLIALQALYMSNASELVLPLAFVEAQLKLIVGELGFLSGCWEKSLLWEVVRNMYWLVTLTVFSHPVVDRTWTSNCYQTVIAVILISSCACLVISRKLPCLSKNQMRLSNVSGSNFPLFFYSII